MAREHRTGRGARRVDVPTGRGALRRSAANFRSDVTRQTFLAEPHHQGRTSVRAGRGHAERKEIDVSCISAHDPQLARLADAIAQRVGQQRFSVWFNNSTRLDLKHDGLEIAVPNDFISEWIGTHFTKPIQDAAHEVLGCPLTVRFNVMPQLFDVDGATVDAAPRDQGAARVVRGVTGTGFVASVVGANVPHRAVTQSKAPAANGGGSNVRAAVAVLAQTAGTSNGAAAQQQ